ncbi:MAG: sensor domain-containing diguanylate cyclase [Candidatus Omnitrophica bacterium]|nr:sensor domain-containing diguanylate cyclase [Candidatus Omnitrophota bacterium]
MEDSLLKNTDEAEIRINEAAEKLKRVERDLSTLYEVSNAMRTTLDLNHILYIILTGVTAHTGLGFNRAVLFLVNEKDQRLEPKMAIGPDSGEDAKRIWDNIQKYNQGLNDLIGKDKLSYNINQSSLYKAIKQLKIPLNSENLLSDVFYTGLATHITQDNIEEYQNDTFLKFFMTKELVIMPLRAKDKVNGLIVADNLFTQKPISDDDLKIFTMLANQAGLAIENSRLYEMIIQKSHTDALTGLWNHGYFQEEITKELERHQSERQSLSLLMIDMDNFKTLNDSHGHQYGDIVLKEIASLLKDSSRETDYVCRYGGEEFSIILTQTWKEQGHIIAERIRQRIEQKDFLKPNSNEMLRTTVSIGLATFPEDGQSKEELITKADKAMYIAKFSGKNQTCSA